MDRDRPDAQEPHRVSLRDRRRELTRQALLDGTLAAFEEHGYTATTIDDIAARAGASRGTFYLYFTKATALLELMRATTPSSAEVVDGRATTDLGTTDLSNRAGVRAWMAPYVGQLTNNPRLMKAYLEGDATDPDVRAITDAYFATSVDDLTGRILAVQGDALSRTEAQVRATIMIVGCHGVTYQVLGRGHEADLELLLDTIADEWLHLMHAPPVRRTDPTGEPAERAARPSVSAVPEEPPSLRARRRELTRKALLDGARNAFTERGYVEVTVDDITNRAGASRGTFYLYFTKASVIAELIRVSTPSPAVTVEGRRTIGLGTADLSSRAAIRARLGADVGLWRTSPQLARAYLEGDATDPDLQVISNAFYGAVINDLIEQIRAVHGDTIGAAEARSRATIMAFTLNSFEFRVFGRGHETDVELGLDTIADQWLRMLTGPPTQPADAH